MNPTHAALALLSCLLLGALLSSCASSPKSRAPTRDVSAGTIEDPRSVVEAERARIESMQRSSEEPLEAVAMDEAVDEGVASGVDDLDCPTTCQIAEDLCASSGTICEIAESHPAEPDFHETCLWATQSCTDARGTCQSCGEPEKGLDG